MNRVTSAVAAEMRAAPGIESAGAHVGRAITSDEIVDVNAGEIWLTVAPDADYNATLAGIRDIAVGYPGVHTSVRTYAEDRVAAAQDKVGDELVVRVYGADLAKLRDTADDVASMLSTVTGVLSPRGGTSGDPAHPADRGRISPPHSVTACGRVTYAGKPPH